MEQIEHLDNEEQYVVSNLKEVVQILTELLKQKALLKVSFNAGSDVYLTTIIGVDTRNDALYLDVGQDAAFNHRLLESTYVLFSKEDGIRIRWASNHLTMVSLEDGNAIKIALPHSLLRLQSREFFRLATPVFNPVSCQIPILDVANAAQSKVLVLPLADISLGGVGLLVHHLDSALVEGTVFHDCQIDLPEVEVANLTLQVRNIIPVPINDGSIKYRVGLMYVKPSPASMGLIHRYTFNLEREFCSRSWNPMA